MEKHLHVFISSTYTDLKEERQAAIDAILKSGHRPIGMEQFLAGDQRQIDLIKDCLDKSDVFLLILGGRYGSIEFESGKSYTQLEYEYAKNKGIPMFSLVITDDLLKLKEVKLGYPNVMELNNRTQYNEFKQKVLGYICEMFNDVKDIQYSIATKLGEITKEKLDKEIEILEKEIKILKQENQNLKSKTSNNTVYQNFPDYDAVKHILQNTRVRISNTDNKFESILNLFVQYQDKFFEGMMPDALIKCDTVFKRMAPHLYKFKFIADTPEGMFVKTKITVVGMEFLRCYELEQFNNTKIQWTI